MRRLEEEGLIVSVRESAAITFILTYKTCKTDSAKYYLYDGDFLELNEETGAVTIGYDEWAKALAPDFEKANWQKFVENIKKNTLTEKEKIKDEEEYYDNYWSAGSTGQPQ